MRFIDRTLVIIFGLLFLFGFALLAFDMDKVGMSQRIYVLAATSIATFFSAMLMIVIFSRKPKKENVQTRFGAREEKTEIVSREKTNKSWPMAIIVVVFVAASGWAYLPQAQIYLAKKAYDNNDYEEALSNYSFAIESYWVPEQLKSDLYFSRAEAYYDYASAFGLGDDIYIKSLEDYNAALHLEPDRMEGYYKRADVYAALGAHAEALANFDIATQLDEPDAFWSYIRRAAYFRETGDYEKALNDLSTLETIWEGEANMPINYHRARTFLLMNRSEEAVSSIIKGLEAQQDFAWSYFYMGCANAQGGNIQQALIDFQKGHEVLMEYGEEFLLVWQKSPAGKHDNIQVAEILELLEKAVQMNTTTVAGQENLCSRLWNHYPFQAHRSSLLP